jgi:hypothetical protein
MTGADYWDGPARTPPIGDANAGVCLTPDGGARMLFNRRQ